MLGHEATGRKATALYFFVSYQIMPLNLIQLCMLVSLLPFRQWRWLFYTFGAEPDRRHV